MKSLFHNVIVCLSSQYTQCAFLLLLVLSSTGCVSSVGSSTIETDRFDYNASISDTRNEELLLNLVRVRYGEAPLFLDVSQILAQYSLERNANLSAGVTLLDADGLDGVRSVSPSIGTSWSVRPTITYSPRNGSDFAKSLLTPIDPVEALSLAQGGAFPTIQVLRKTIRSINGISARAPNSNEYNPQYVEMLQALYQASSIGAIGLATVDGDKPYSVLRFRNINLDTQARGSIENLRELWRLDPEINEFRIVYGSAPDAPDQIAFLTNSILDLLRDYASYISVPEEHIEQGWTRATQIPPAEDHVRRAPIHVRATESPTNDAFIEVSRYGVWYSIAMGDYDSKEMFGMLVILLQLTERGGGTGGPVISIGS